MRASRSHLRVASVLAALALACRRAPPAAPARFTDLAAPGSDAPTVARPCAQCHRAQYDTWRRSQHAAAQRPVDPSRDPSPPVAGVTVRAVLGVAPLQQALVAVGGGRVQVFDPAWDVGRREWFSVFGAEVRRPEAWGHWTQRGMNWNSQCAACHTTAFAKGYQARADTYQSTWSAAGVACAQCHGAMAGHAARPVAGGAWRTRTADTCASCHARREELTGDFEPGQRFDDHYRLTLADTPGAYHPDGQVADEDFEFASLSMSRMGHRGVTCLDCHEPHGGGLRAPITRDQLCMTCHGSPSARGAPSISPERHTHHAAASEGARCVSCHMPASTFMQRDRRRDHGFTSPDPTLTRELGVPNACERCHAGQAPGWAERRTDAWYGAAMERPARRRARLVARARRHDETAVAELVAAVGSEAIDAWRAALVALLAPWGELPEVRAALVAALRDPSPWVQAAAVRALEASGAVDDVAALRRASTRLVRVEATWATRATLGGDTEARRELARWLDATNDQPAGALRRSELALVEGRTVEARAWAERAAAWDPSGVSFAMLGRVRAATGDVEGAVRAFGEAMRAEPSSAAHPYARGLCLAEAGRMAEAVADLERAVAIDPSFARARYNLELARARLSGASGSAR